MKYDIIIIGSGLGGLTAGAKLAREGKKVLVLERHDRPGGYATTFQRGEFTIEVGLHEMYGPAPGDIKSRIFSDLEVFREVTFLPLPDFYRFVNGRVDVCIPHDPSLAKERLSAIFPDEIEGINAYFGQLLKPKNKNAEADQADISLGEFLDSNIRNEDLKLVLLGNLGYYHDDPYQLSLAYYTISQGKFFSGGASYIKGGSQKLSDHLASYIRNKGGEVMLNHEVTAILTESHTVSGVRFINLKKDKAETFEAFADEIICNNAMPAAAELLPEPFRDAIRQAVSSQQSGISLLSLYLGFNRKPEELGHRHYSTFVYDEEIRTTKDILPNTKNGFEKRIYTFIDYGQINSCLAPAGKSTGVICTIDALSAWENLNEADYRKKKEEVAKTLIARLEKLIPGISECITYYELGTPRTLKRYTLNPGGAVYGFAQTPAHPATDTSALPKNLHFASAWGKTGGGFSGAIYSGYLCATNLMRKKKVE